MTSDVAPSRRLPPELRVREAADADLERIVEFQNRWATPAQWQSPTSARHTETAMPDPSRVRLLVEDPQHEIVAVGITSNGGPFRSPDGSWRMNLRVDPKWRRRGIGGLLLEQLEQHARVKGASRLITAVRGDETDGAKFAESTGFRKFHERIDAYIDVAKFDGSKFEDPDAIAARAGVRLVTYAEQTRRPAAELEAFQRGLLPVIWEIARDVPAPTPMPTQPPPFEQARRMFFEGPDQDAQSTIVVMHGDQAVGMTATALKANGTAYTNFTGVSREWRGKGLALAMKLRALRELKARGVKLFGTTNDDQNAAMRGINKRLGYVPDAPTLLYEKKFT